jgi:hypothetical protein
MECREAVRQRTDLSGSKMLAEPFRHASRSTEYVELIGDAVCRTVRGRAEVRVSHGSCSFHDRWLGTTQPLQPAASFRSNNL